MKRLLPTVILACSVGLVLTLGTGCNSSGQKNVPAALSTEKVLTIGDKIITRQEYDPIFRTYTQLFNINDNQQALENPIIQEKLKRMTISKLILMNLIQQEAEKESITVSDEKLKKLREETVTNAGGEEAFKLLLQRSHLDPDGFNAMLREQLLISSVLEKVAGDELKIDDAEAKKYFSEHPDQFKVPERIKSRHILIKAVDKELKQELLKEDPDLKEEALVKQLEAKKIVLKKKAETIFQEVKQSPGKFPELAKKYSEGPSGPRGGDLGFMEERNTEPTYWQALKNTTVGQLYPKVVASPFGYHILRVEENQPARTLPFDEAKEGIKTVLLNEKKQRVLESWVKDREAQVNIVIEPDYKAKEPGELIPEEGDSAASESAVPSKKSAPGTVK